MCEIVVNRRLRIMLPQECIPSVYDDRAGLIACCLYIVTVSYTRASFAESRSTAPVSQYKC